MSKVIHYTLCIGITEANEASFVSPGGSQGEVTLVMALGAAR